MHRSFLTDQQADFLRDEKVALAGLRPTISEFRGRSQAVVMKLCHFSK